jgi:putative flippase GtrA
MCELFARHRQFMVFLIGGGASALIDVGLMQLLIVNGANFVVATSAGFAAGLLFNYTFHARLTFPGPATRYAFLRYICVVAVNYLVTLACVGAAVAMLGSPLAGKIVALFIVPVSGFIFGKHWIFK